MSPLELLSPSLTCRTLLLAYVWVTHMTKEEGTCMLGFKKEKILHEFLEKKVKTDWGGVERRGGGALSKLLRFLFYLSFLISKI